MLSMEIEYYKEKKTLYTCKQPQMMAYEKSEIA